MEVLANLTDFLVYFDFFPANINYKSVFLHLYFNYMIGTDEEIRKMVNIVFDKYDQNKNGHMEYP